MKTKIIFFLFFQVVLLYYSDAKRTVSAQQAMQQESDIISSAVATGVTDNDLRKGYSLGLFLNGADPLYTSMIEDAFWVKLTKEGFRVADRSKIEKILADEMMQREDAKTEKAKGIITALGIAKKAGVNTILTGNIIADVTQSSTPGAGVNTASKVANRLVITGASLQLIDVQSERVLLGIIADFGYGKGLQEATTELVKALRKEVTK